MKPLTSFFKKFTFTPINILKVAILLVAALFVIAFLLSMMSMFFNTARGGIGGMMREGFAVSMPSSGTAQFYKEEAAYDSDMSFSAGGYAGNAATLSIRNISPSVPPFAPMPGTPTGDTAEDYEVTEYSAAFESQDKEATCGTIAGLKSRSYVVFLSANTYDGGCNYSFKVKHGNVEEVLALLKKMDPKDLSENTYTIKAQIDDFTSETEILEKKRASIDATLEDAIAAYDEIQKIATANQDAESLARIIDSKIQLIERLSQERININEQLDRYGRAKADQLDRLEYTHFSANVFERLFIDEEGIVDSWKESVRQFFLDINRVAQDLTVNFILLIVLAIQYILYLLLLVFIAKFVWKAVRYIWNR